MADSSLGVSSLLPDAPTAVDVDYDDTGEVPKSKKIETFISCPICDDIFRSANFGVHLNNSDIARNVWPDVSFLGQHHRLVCSACKFCYDERWIRVGCHRVVGSGKRCGG